MRVLLGSSFYDDWQEAGNVRHPPTRSATRSTSAIPGTRPPRRARRSAISPANTRGSFSRWLDPATGEHLALDTGGGPLARLWSTALNSIVDFPYVRATGQSVRIQLPKTAALPETELEWKIPQWSNTLERNRARSYFQAYAAAAALYFLERAMSELHAGNTATFTPFQVPQEAIGCGFHEAVRGALSHHLVIRDGRIANYHPYPPTPWNASPRDSFGTPGPFEDAVQNTPIFEESTAENFKGIDVMRTVRSFDPCLPCGVHMYIGPGRVVEVHHSPTFGVPRP